MVGSTFLRSLGRACAGGAMILFAVVTIDCGDSASTGGSGATGSGGGGQSGCASPCELAPQCGCTTPQACTLDGAGNRLCAPAGTGKPGDDCKTAGCQAGSACVVLSSSPELDICEAFCSTDADCPGTTCSKRLSDDKGGTLDGVALCGDACDPIAQTGCPVMGTACIIEEEQDGEKRWFTGCDLPQSALVEGDTCTGACGPGLLCGGPSGMAATCHELCTPDGTHACTAPATCHALSDPLVIAGVEYGACL